jgi:hypothetical protein
MNESLDQSARACDHEVDTEKSSNGGNLLGRVNGILLPSL